MESNQTEVFEAGCASSSSLQRCHGRNGVGFRELLHVLPTRNVLILLQPAVPGGKAIFVAFGVLLQVRNNF